MKSFKGISIVCILFFSIADCMAVENFPDSHQHHHHAVIGHSKKNFMSPRFSGIFSCNLYAYSKQCRKYEILEGAKTTLSEIQEGCESMGGIFSSEQCPSTNVLAECRDIIRNYHQPDVIYLNIYYESEDLLWTLDTVTRVCGDLGGELFKQAK